MAFKLDFDPQLPDLRLALDPDAAARLFEERWPAPGAAARVRSARLQDVKYQPERRCTATYTLQIDRGGAPEQTIGVVELTPGGAAHRLYDDDPRLPGLREAADAQRMGPRLAALLGGQPADCAVTPVRYRAGVRCVFRYAVSAGGEPRVLFGKLLGEGAAELAATIAGLHQACLASAAMPRVLPALAFWPELGMVLQPEVAGHAELNDLAFDPAVDQGVRERWLRDAGARLVGLHEASGVAAEPRTIADDLDELREYVAPMGAIDPALAGRYGETLERVARRAETLDQVPVVVSHGAFRTDQLMIDGDQLVMIDLDGVCRANPARDVGNFLAYLRWKAIRRPQQAELITRGGQLFLEGYQAARRPVATTWLAVYQAVSLLKIAGRRYRSLSIKEWPLVPALVDAALEALDQAS